MNCMLWAFSKATGISPEEFIKGIGHDGSEPWPYPDSKNTRSFHIQEFISYLYNFHGVAVTPLEPMPTIPPDFLIKVPIPRPQGVAVLTGLRRRSGIRHAALWLPDGTVVDNNGETNPPDFEIDCFWCLDSILKPA